MLDTVTVNAIVKSHPSGVTAKRRFTSLGSNEYVAISVITEGEILYGLAKKPEATRLRATLNAFLATIEVLPWTRAVAEVYGELRADFERKGTPLGNLDTLIVAQAITAQAILVTHDNRLKSTLGLYRSPEFVEDWLVSA